MGQIDTAFTLTQTEALERPRQSALDQIGRDLAGSSHSLNPKPL
jgi:hypothetical protein